MTQSIRSPQEKPSAMELRTLLLHESQPHFALFSCRSMVLRFVFKSSTGFHRINGHEKDSEELRIVHGDWLGGWFVVIHCKLFFFCFEGRKNCENDGESSEMTKSRWWMQIYRGGPSFLWTIGMLFGKYSTSRKPSDQEIRSLGTRFRKFFSVDFHDHDKLLESKRLVTTKTKWQLINISHIAPEVWFPNNLEIPADAISSIPCKIMDELWWITVICFRSSTTYTKLTISHQQHTFSCQRLLSFLNDDGLATCCHGIIKSELGEWH